MLYHCCVDCSLTESRPTWKRGLYWFLGYRPDQDQEVPEEGSMIKNIDEDPFWKKFTLVNAVICAGVAFAIMGWWW